MSTLPTMAELQDDVAKLLKDWEAPDLAPEVLAAYEAQLAKLIEAQTLKIDGIARYFKFQDAYVEACKKEIKLLQLKISAAENRIAWLKRHYLAVMGKHGIQKIKGDAYSMSVRRTQAVDVYDLDALVKDAPEYIKERVEIVPDKIGLKEALQEGEEIPGARLIERESLQVR